MLVFCLSSRLRICRRRCTLLRRRRRTSSRQEHDGRQFRHVCVLLRRHYLIHQFQIWRLIYIVLQIIVVLVSYQIHSRSTRCASHCSIFDLINFDSALLRDVHRLGDSDRHVLSNSWWLQSIVRSQEDGVDIFQCPTFGLRSEEVEDDNR